MTPEDINTNGMAMSEKPAWFYVVFLLLAASFVTFACLLVVLVLAYGEQQP